MVGFGGNNGSTILGGILANKHRITWMTKKGEQKSNMFGSMTQCSTMKIGETEDKEVYMKIKDVVPMVDPKNLIISGWDINSANLAESMKRAQVFDF
jgi:myo-inositol-1-phosphate synthase